uniref:Uncharacterized protein n=1 Tax=Melopsittacus undulatus TaxID=13146 RepID=A0A8V5H328_MELUD
SGPDSALDPVTDEEAGEDKSLRLPREAVGQLAALPCYGRRGAEGVHGVQRLPWGRSCRVATRLSRRRVSCRDLGRVDCDGWLLKKKEHVGFMAHKWKRCWFVLKGHTLYWYHHPNDEKAVGLLNVATYDLESTREQKKKYVFQLCHQRHQPVPTSAGPIAQEPSGEDLECLMRSLKQGGVSLMGRQLTQEQYRRSFIRRSKNPLINAKVHMVRALQSTLKVGACGPLHPTEPPSPHRAPFTPQSPLHPIEHPSPHRAPFTPQSPLHPIEHPSPHRAPFTPQSPLHPTEHPSPHRAPFTPQSPLHPTEHPSPHRAPFTPQSPLHPTEHPSPHRAPFTPQSPLHPTEHPSPHRAPFTPQSPLQPTEHPSPHRAPLTPQSTLHPTEHPSPHRAPLTPQSTLHPTEHPSPHRAPFTPQSTLHPTEHPSPHRAPLTPQITLPVWGCPTSPPLSQQAKLLELQALEQLLSDAALTSESFSRWKQEHQELYQELQQGWTRRQGQDQDMGLGAERGLPQEGAEP